MGLTQFLKKVMGKDAIDAAVSGNPVLTGGRASTATPTAVSGDGDSQATWVTREGSVQVSLVPGQTGITAGAGAVAASTPRMTLASDDPAVAALQASQKGASTLANGQVAASTTAGTLVASRATRRRVTIKNTDGTITVYVGIATVSAANGMPLLAGESITFDTTALVQVISASGTPTVAYVEEYD